MAVAEPTPILARSLIAQYARIPALVQTPSFLWKAKPIQKKHIYTESLVQNAQKDVWGRQQNKNTEIGANKI